jgi:hypothetical protein
LDYWVGEEKEMKKINESQFFTITSFAVALVIAMISIQFFFNQDYIKLIDQVEKTLTNFSNEKENSISQFLADKSEPLEFVENEGSINTINIISGGQAISMDDLRKLLYVEQQKTLRLNAYLVNDKGDLLTAQKEFDISNERATTKIIRNELLDQCLKGNNFSRKFYTGIDEGNRSVYGTYQKVPGSLPLCLFSETEKVTNIDIPAQQILKRYIFWGMLFVLVITFLSGYFSSFSSSFSIEEMLLFVLCGAAGISYCFIVTLVTRGVNYFSLETYFLEWGMATLSFFLLIVMIPLKKGKYLKIGSLLLGVYFLLTIFFNEYRQAYELSSIWRNLILVLMRFLSITGFLSLFFSFKKNLKL